MHALETAKAAPARAERDLQNVDQLGGVIESENSLRGVQAQRLATQFRLSLDHAALIAAHAFRGLA